MSNRKIGWAFSAERPVAVQSPSMLPLSDIQAKLNFSAVKSPSVLPKKVSLINVNRTTPTTLLRSTNNRLADYHMSKQNPDVLDRMYSSSLPSSPQNGYINRNNQTLTSPMSHNRTTSNHSMTGLSFQNHVTHTPVQMSLLRQTLKANRGQSSSGNGQTSLVQLATKRGSVRINGSVPISPVVVKLSRSDTPPSMVVSDKDTTPGLSNGIQNGAVVERVSDPCDKDVILSALRSRRKRWATSTTDETLSPSTNTTHGQPLAKRSRHDEQSLAPPTLSQSNSYESTSSRKRPYTHNSVSQTPTTNKRSKVTKPTSQKRNKICVPEIEYESDTEHAQSEVAMAMVTVVNGESNNEECADPITKKKSPSPPIVPIDDEMIKKREASLNVLKTVFQSSTKSENSLRRKVPVFCATGHKPHMPGHLSTTRTATKEDLMKDRESAAEKLREFLAADDQDTTSPPTSKPTEDTKTLSVSPKTTVTVANPLTGVKLGMDKPTDESKAPLITSLASNSVTTAQTTVATSKTKQAATPSVDPLKMVLKTAPLTKSVSFANPPASNLIPSVTTTISQTATGMISTDSLLKPPQGSLQTVLAAEKPAAVVAGGGLSLSTVATGLLKTASPTASLRQSKPQATNNIQFKVPSTTQPLQNAVPSLSSTLQLAAPNNSTQPGGLQLAAPNNSTQPGGLQLAAPNSSTQPGGIQLAAPNNSTQPGGLQLAAPNSSTQPGGLQLAAPNNSTQPGGLQLAAPNSSTQPGGLQLATPNSSTQPGGLQLAAPNSSTQPGGLQLAAPSTQSSGIQLGVTTPSLGLFQSNTRAPSPLKTCLSLTSTNTTSQGFSFKVTGTSGLTQSLNNAPQQQAVQQQQQPVQQNLNSAQQNPALNLTSSKPSLSFGVQNPQQASSGLLFGGSSKPLSVASQNAGGLSFGNNTPTSTSQGSQPSSGGILFGKGTSGNAGSSTQQASGGLLFGNNTSNNPASSQLSRGGSLQFGNSNSGGASSGLSFGLSQTTQPQQTSMFGNQSSKEGSKSVGLLFGNSATQSTANTTNSNFSFSAGSGAPQQPSNMFSAVNPSQSMSLNFGGGGGLPKLTTQGTTGFNGGLGFNAQSKESQSILGGSSSQVNSSSGFNFSASPAQTQQTMKNVSSSGFNFGNGQTQLQLNAGASSLQKTSQNGQLNFGQNTQGGQGGLNFGIGQTQNGNSGFSFKPSSGATNGRGGLSLGQGGGGLSFGASNNANTSQGPLATGQGAGVFNSGNIFNSPQPNPQSNKSGGSGFSFTPQQTPSQQGFNFSVATPSQTGFSFGVTTPTANPFAPGDSTPRNSSRARRRNKKK